ncbi:MAG: hypothetical protein AAGA56_07180 [Myxococcota bacterium]
MRFPTVTTKLVATLALVVLAGASAACGPSTPPAKLAQVSAGSMPSDGVWTGVYYSPLFGYLHLEAAGSTVKGRWLRPRKDQWGELTGEADGNLLKFEWAEYVDGLVGPNSKKKGKGYFVYKRPEGDNVDDLIEGEIGRGGDEVGTPWDAVKQRNVEPDLSSIGGTGVDDVGGGDWDGPNREEGAPEPPAEPPGDAPGNGDEEEEDAPEL